MALWQAEQITPDGNHCRLREALLQVATQFQQRHPEHSLTTIRKALIAWLGLRLKQLTDRSAGSAHGPFTSLVKVAAADGTLTIYAVSTEHLASRLGQTRPGRMG